MGSVIHKFGLDIESIFCGTWDSLVELAALDLVLDVRQLDGLCESPIELRLGIALLLASRFRHQKPLMVCDQSTIQYMEGDDTYSFLVPQYKIGKYRIDLAIFHDATKPPVLVECDGHDFHERTKDQARHDREKDRTFTRNGDPLLRFTGSEIHKDAGKCAVEILEYIFP